MLSVMYPFYKIKKTKENKAKQTKTWYLPIVNVSELYAITMTV